MTISRAQLAAYLDQDFGALADAIGQTADDDSIVGYGPDIDNALRKLGTSESELEGATVEEGKRDAVFTLAEYYAARRIWRHLASRANVKVDDSQFDYRQVLTSIKQVVDDARQQCQALGYDVTGGGWGVGQLNLDWLEPQTAE